MNKLDFLKSKLPELMLTLAPDAKGTWSGLNGQQMVEHLSDSIREATGKLDIKIQNPPEVLEKAFKFAMSTKQFRPGTKNVNMPTEPVPTRLASMQDAVDEYKAEVADFIKYFEEHPGETLPNPFFGNFTFENWTHLLYKHCVHHCKQFGLLEEGFDPFPES